MTEIIYDDGIETNRRPDVKKSWVSAYGLLYFATCVSWAAPSQLLLGMQMQQLDASNKEAMLGMLMTIGGTVQVIASIFAGTLSDRTKTRWGKRLPWILVGGFGACATLFLISFTPSYWVMVSAWAAFQFFTVLSTNNILTLTPDTVPQRQYGMVSGVLGATFTFGLVGGTIIAEAFPLQTAYLVVVGLFVAILLTYTLTGTWKHSRDVHAAEAEERARAEADNLANNIAAITRSIHDYVDYLWVFAARFVVHLGNYVALFFLYYYLQDQIKLDDPEGGVLILTVIYAAVTILSAIVGGKWSDRVQKRKIFVVASALLAGGAAIMMAFVHAWPMVITAGIILGIGWGTFTSVDQALINEVLPHAQTRARDMSIMTLTVGITNMLAGISATFALKAFGGYPGLYICTGIITVIGALLVLPVKRSR